MTATTCPPPVPREQQVASLEPSSNRTNTMPLDPSAGMIFGTQAFSHASPVAIGQECMSLHSFGVIQAKRGKPRFRSPWNCVNGTILLHRAVSLRMSLKYMKGSCFFAYSFGDVPADEPLKHGLGIDSMYAFHEIPFASS